ncbi:unnamed protein product [Cylindrotheca closterium]|uniref:Uncharacterized protein n=1 Tax=Cylindrotheca closterium TaxID=2856 RepID=A0AAD2GAX9_9STRA|nr:unnamed protein product [Cylindrotheca closterium]
MPLWMLLLIMLLDINGNIPYDSLFVADGNPTYQIYDVVLVAKQDDDNGGTIKEDMEREWNVAKSYNGQVIQMTNRFGEQVYQNTTGYSLTIEDIFGLIKTGMDENYSTLDVEYDDDFRGDYGFPKRVVLVESAVRAEEAYTLTFDYLAPISKWQNELGAAKALWSKQNLSTYNYRFFRQCECIEEANTEALVKVVDGNVAAIDLGSPTFGEAFTMDGLFTIIEDAINAKAFRVDVTYNREYGYPISVYIDYEEMVVGADFIISAWALTPLTKWQTELEAGKLLWSEQNLKTYDHTCQRSCRCPDGMHQQLCECSDESQLAKLVQVVDGKVFAVDGSPVQATQRSSSASLDEVPTLGGLFTIIQEAINGNAFRVDVDYDPEYAYPVLIDFTRDPADEECIISAILEEVKDGGAREDSGPASSALKTTTTLMGHLGIASLLLCMIW